MRTCVATSPLGRGSASPSAADEPKPGVSPSWPLNGRTLYFPGGPAMPLTQADILQFYEDFRSHGGWDHIETMRTFLPRLFRERSLDGCTLFTSHETLCIVRYPSYPAWCDKPLLSINCTAKDRLQLELRITRDAKPVHRAFTESASCPLDLGLVEFDRLYAKFLDAHNEPPLGGEV